MVKLSLLEPLLVLAIAMGAYAATIRPVTNLVITDKTVAPDGFPRAAVVVNGSTPGPLIIGNKVRSHILIYDSLHCEQDLSTQGDRFRINVTDSLTNHTMNKTTSIVSLWCLFHLVVHKN